MTQAQDRALAKFQADFDKAFGSGRLVRPKVAPYEVISTGSLALDLATGVGGYVEGRITEIYGVDDIGKTSLAILGLVEAQRKHPQKQTAFLDMEGKFDPSWAQRHGLDLERNFLLLPDNAEDVADALKMVVRSGLFSMVVVDSIGAMIPEAMKTKDADESVVGKQASIVTRMVNIASTEARKTGVVVLLINQVRANISNYGPDMTTGGGFALKHVTTMKFKMRKTGTAPYVIGSGDDKETVGYEIATLVERNKVAVARHTAIFNFMVQATDRYGPLGVDKAHEATVLGERHGIIERKGGWYSLPDGERLQGGDKVADYLRDRPDMVAEIRQQVVQTRANEVKADEITEGDDA